MRREARRTRSSRSAASTRATPRRWSMRAPAGSASCGRSATPATRPPPPRSCATPSRRSERRRQVPEQAPAGRPRKRKQRGAPSGRERMERGYAKAEQRNREAREALEPLAEGERPLVVTIGAVVAGLVALSIVVGYLAGAEVNGEKPQFVQVLAPVLIM